MSAIEKRNQYAAQILAGFAANPAIFAHNDQCGWCLVNCTDGQIAAYAVRLANELFAATEAIDLNGTAEGKEAHREWMNAPLGAPVETNDRLEMFFNPDGDGDPRDD